MKLLYADVLLPLKLNQAYSYLIPEKFQETIAIGHRVLVSFGKSKYYAGIVTRIHNQNIDNLSPKYIEESLDQFPIVSHIQLNLWNWLADYYMCSLGEVMDTALPNYFKLSSDRFYRLTEHPNLDNIELEEDAELIAEAIRGVGQISIHEIKAQFGHGRAIYSLRVLIDKGIVEPVEIVQEKYLAKFEKIVEIHPEIDGNQQKINDLFQNLSGRAEKQSKMLLEFFSIKQKNGIVPKSLLLKESETGNSSYKSLIDKSVFIEKQRQIDRFQTLEIHSKKNVSLSDYQENTYCDIIDSFQSKMVTLLHGITGSGKTEIYIKWIQDAMEKGESVLYILPEIALTQQIVSRLSSYFGSSFIVYHSLVSPNRKYEIWNKVYRGEVRFVVGTRSSIFLPFQKLDRIIIDEEHDQSLKQIDTAPKFHARDALINYAVQFNSKVLLGSATPSLESYLNAQQGKYGYVTLNSRFGEALIPDIELIDLRKSEIAAGMIGHYSEKLISALREQKLKGEQSILFQNRRGYSPYIQCNTCGHIPKCMSCDVSLTYHSFLNILICHYCNKKYPMPKLCQDCKSPKIKTKGIGTQKVEDDLSLLIPEIKLGRIDTDIARSENKIDRVLEAMQNRELDVLIGTQMVSKGLDFDNITLLGVIQADIFLSNIDYKSDEKAYQVLTQVCGRVGRGLKPGKVLIQTFQPDHPIIRYVLEQNWTDYVERELSLRQEFYYPPYVKLVKIDIRHVKIELLEIYSKVIATKLNETLQVPILGPSIPSISRIRNQYIREILIKLPRNKEIQSNKRKIRQIIDNELIKMPNRNFSIDIQVDV